MASNDWFGKMKKGAQMFQETAKTKLDKLSETVDKKRKEIQEDLGKERTKTESEPKPTLRVWRPSSDNSDGEIIIETKPIPRSTASSSEQNEASVSPTILAELEPTLPVTSTAEIQQATPPPAASVEEIVVVSRKSKGKKSSTKHTNNQAETTNRNNDANKEAVDQEPENKRASDQTNTISTIPEISEDAPVKPTLTQEAFSQPKTSANQENTQQVISNDTLAANVDDENKPIEQSNQENTPINELNTETVETDQNQLLSTENLQSTDAITTVLIASTNDVQNAEVENSVSEDVYNSTDEPKAETTSNETSLDGPSTKGENIDNETSVTEISTVTTNDRVPLEDSVSVDEPTTSTNTDKFDEEHPVQEDAEKELSHDNYIQKNISTDEPASATNTEQLIEKYSTSEDIQNNVLKEELTSTSNDNLIPDNVLVDEPITLTDIKQLVEEHSVQEDTQKESSCDDDVQENISIDEPILATNAEDLIEEYPDTEDQQRNVSNDDHVSVDEPITSTSANQSTEEQLVSEGIHKKLSYDNQIPETISAIERSTLSNADQLAEEYPVTKDTQNNISKDEVTNTHQSVEEHLSPVDTNKELSNDDHALKNIPADEATTSTNTEQLIEEYPASMDTQKDVPNEELTNTTGDKFISENLPVDEPLISTNTEQSTEEERILEADLISEITADDEPVTEQPVSENIYEETQHHALTTETIDNCSSEETSIIQLKDKSHVEQHVTKSVDKEPSDDDDAVPVEIITPENIQVIESADELSSPFPEENISSTIDNVAIDPYVLDDNMTLSIYNADSSSVNSQPENISSDTLNDDFVFSTKSDEILVDKKTHDDLVSIDTQSDVENIPTHIPNDESSNKINPINIEPENETDEDLSSIEFVNKSSDENNTSISNMLSNVSENAMELPAVSSKLESITNIVPVESKLENLPTPEPDVIVSPAESAPAPKEEAKKLVEKPKAKSFLFDDSDSDDDFLNLSKKKIPSSKVPNSFDDELKATKVKIETLLNEPDDIFEYFTISKISKQNSTTESPKQSHQLSSVHSCLSTVDKHVTNTMTTVVPLSSSLIEEVSHVLPIPSVPTATDEMNPFEEVDESNSKTTVESNLFDQDDEPTTSTMAVQIEQDLFEDDNGTNPFGEVEESIETNPFGDVDEPTDQTNPFGEDEDDTNPFNEVGQSASTNPFDDDTNTTSTTITRIIQPRYSVINYHPIPPYTKISQISCSSLYIYFCTIDHELFFAELNLSDPSQPFNWQQHSDLAERLVVSINNRSVWRFFNKCIYIANNPFNYPPFGSHWNAIKIDDDQSLLSMSISDQCGWYVKEDGTLWFLRTDDKTFQSTNVPCSYALDIVFCCSEKIGVTTNIGEILVRVGCTFDCPEGGGWLFIEKRVGFIDDFILLTNNDIMMIMDKKHRLWMYEWSTKTDFHEILLSDDFDTKKKRYLLGINTELLYITDCEKGIYVYSDAITGVQWNVIEKSSPYLRLFAAFSSEDYVWAITSSRLIGSSNGQILDKPDAAGALTHASFVPNTSSKKSILWALDQFCDIYVRSDIEKDTVWEPTDDSQFEKKRKLLNIVCNNSGVWAVDDRGNIHFRHGHISANQHNQSKENSLLAPAWITVPGDAEQFRSFVQVFCGPADWMVYATDTKQNVYTRIGISATDRVGTAWKLIEGCSALELAISEHRLWLLTSHGQIECREDISLENSIGTRSVTLSGHFRSLTVSLDDSQVWALDSKRNLLKLDRLTVLFKN